MFINSKQIKRGTFGKGKLQKVKWIICFPFFVNVDFIDYAEILRILKMSM